MSDILNGIGNLAKSVTNNVSSYEIRRITEKMQNMVMNFTEAESAVRDATSEEPWGPTGQQMKEVCHLTYQYDTFHQVMSMLWKRLLEDNKNAWRRVYKSLVLLNYLLQHGSERVIQSARDHLFQMRSLEHYKFTDEKGRDQGVNVRHRAKIVIELAQDEDKLREERKKAKHDSKDKYQGFTQDEMRMGRTGSYNKRDDDDFRKKNTFDDDYKEPREVNSFSFPSEGRRGSNSPELGFRDEGKIEEPPHEDDFGDFTSARSRPAVAASVPKAQTAGAVRVGAAADAIPPPIAPPSAVQLARAPVAGTKPLTNAAPASAAVDLLGLEMSAPTSNVLDSSMASLPRPPSGGAGAFSNEFTSDPYGGIAQSNGSSANLFEADWSSVPIPSATSPITDGFADFASFTTAPPLQQQPLAVPMQPATSPLISADLFSLPLAPAPVSASALSPSSRPPAPNTSASPSLSSSSKTLTTASTPSKIGSTWADATGLINLDNIASKGNTGKLNITMNQMQKPSAPGNSTLPW